jgi:hypothetical protein
MAKSFKEIKGKAGDPRRDGSDTALRAVALRAENRDELVGLGGRKPLLTKNTKLVSVWKELLADDPISYSDPNQWRKPADVRPSSFPFCPRKYVLERLGLRMPSDFTISANFYTEIGKAVHYVAQNALARTGRLWGLWKCPNPNCSNPDPRKLTSAKPNFMPAACKHCKHDKLEYEEIRLEDEAIGLRGHTDGILVYKNYSGLLEIKSAGHDKVEKLLSLSDEDVSLLFQAEAPWYGYFHQASTYASLANMKFKGVIPPVTCVQYLIFSRDDPKTVASFTLEVPDLAWWTEIRARIVMAQEAKSLMIVPVGFAKNQADLDVMPSCRWCSHKDVCLQPEGKVRFSADALYSIQAKAALDEVLERERLWVASSEAT